jgi:hypothetical protein
MPLPTETQPTSVPKKKKPREQPGSVAVKNTDNVAEASRTLSTTVNENGADDEITEEETVLQRIAAICNQP